MQNYLVYEYDRQSPDSAGILEAKNEKDASVKLAKYQDESGIEGIDESRIIMVKAENSTKEFTPYKVDIRIDYIYMAKKHDLKQL